eukprot:CCRYP_004579-RA/>CCRYP_004579-RA protein AED:0.50 eAED:0.29 QI:0/-1/0/1/-1/0/1/0/196
MILSAYSDAAYLIISKSCSSAGTHIICSENDPVPSHNVPVLTITQIIKFVTSSTAESKLVTLFICTKEMVPLCQSLIKMGWPQPQSSIQTDNTKALGVANKAIIAKKMKSIDMRLWWLCCCESQGQFRYYWGPGPSTLQTTPPKPTQTSIMNLNAQHTLDNLALHSLQGCVETTLFQWTHKCSHCPTHGLTVTVSL